MYSYVRFKSEDINDCEVVKQSSDTDTDPDLDASDIDDAEANIVDSAMFVSATSMSHVDSD